MTKNDQIFDNKKNDKLVWLQGFAHLNVLHTNNFLTI